MVNISDSHLNKDSPKLREPYLDLKIVGGLQEGWFVEIEGKRAGPFLRQELDSCKIAESLQLDFRRVARTLVQLNYGLNSMKLDWAIEIVRYSLGMLEVEAKVNVCSPCQERFTSSEELQEHFDLRHPEIRLSWLFKNHKEASAPVNLTEEFAKKRASVAK